MSKNFAALALGVFALAGCGSGGSSGPDVLSFSEIVDFGTELNNEFGAAAVTASMPTSGSADYAGVGAASPFSSTPQGIIDTATSVYQVEASVNFGDSSFEGRAYNFQSTSAGLDFEGEIEVDGTITGSGFTGTFDGTLQQNGVNVSYNGSVGGNFVGDNADAMIGTGSGVQSAPGTVPQRVFNYWGAERQ